MELEARCVVGRLSLREYVAPQWPMLMFVVPASPQHSLGSLHIFFRESAVGPLRYTQGAYKGLLSIRLRDVNTVVASQGPASATVGRLEDYPLFEICSRVNSPDIESIIEALSPGLFEVTSLEWDRRVLKAYHQFVESHFYGSPDKLFAEYRSLGIRHNYKLRRPQFLSFELDYFLMLVRVVEKRSTLLNSYAKVVAPSNDILDHLFGTAPQGVGNAASSASTTLPGLVLLNDDVVWEILSWVGEAATTHTIHLDYYSSPNKLPPDLNRISLRFKQAACVVFVGRQLATFVYWGDLNTPIRGVTATEIPSKVDDTSTLLRLSWSDFDHFAKPDAPQCPRNGEIDIDPVSQRIVAFKLSWYSMDCEEMLEANDGNVAQRWSQLYGRTGMVENWQL